METAWKKYTGAQFMKDSDIEMVKCPACGWVHFVCEDGNGNDVCFRCAKPAKLMVAASYEDCPLGCTIQPVNMRNFECLQKTTISP